MSEMLAARPDRDFVAAEPARRAPRQKAPSARGRGKPKIRIFARLASAAFAFVRARPGHILVASMLLAGAGAIAWNALAVQTKRHPAPIFGSGKPSGAPPIPPVRPAPLAQSAPVPAPLPAPSAAPLAQAPAPAASAPAPARVAAPPSAPQARPSSRDPIAEVIRGSEAPVVRSAPAPAARPAPPRDEIAELIRGGGIPIPPANVGASSRPAR